MKLKDKPLKYKITGISLALYAAACCLPAVYARPSYQGMAMEKTNWGIECLLSGGIGCLYTSSSPGHITWMANIFFLLAIIALKYNRVWAFLPAFPAVWLSIAFWSCQRLVMNEGGSLWNVYHKGPGYYMWVLSCVTLFIGTLVYAYSVCKNKKRVSAQNGSSPG